MSNPKHTPGPWTVYPQDQGGQFGSNIRAKGTTFEECQANAEANARLIAAAPELLEALERVFEDLYTKKLGELSFGGRKMLNEAIAKATGGVE